MCSLEEVPLKYEKYIQKNAPDGSRLAQLLARIMNNAHPLENILSVATRTEIMSRMCQEFANNPLIRSNIVCQYCSS